MTKDTLSERELLEWWRVRDAQASDQLDKTLSQLAGHVASHNDVNQLSDLVSDKVMQREDEMLFHVGTLCLRNGQRALWSQVYYLFLTHEGDLPAEDEFEFLDRMTAEARVAISSSDPSPQPAATEPAETVEPAIYSRLAAVGGPDASRLLGLLDQLVTLAAQTDATSQPGRRSKPRRRPDALSG